MEVDIVEVLVGHIARIKLADYRTLHLVQLLLFLGLFCRFQLKENYIKTKHFFSFKKIIYLDNDLESLAKLRLDVLRATETLETAPHHDGQPGQKYKVCI